MKTEVPSEFFLLAHRFILFLDEWLFYTLLGVLYYTQRYPMMIPAGLFGGAFLIYSYYRQWKLEEKRFGPNE